ncbi:MAG: carboxypeptidase regulatory-like domain-containing protein [Candidatus Neomarinimicrobiota bacterium]
MRIKSYHSIFTLLVVIALFGSVLSGQGLTTASMRGTVTNDNGDFLVGANVVAVHVPTNTEYGTAVRDGGLFDLPNMKIGGPYRVTVSFVGYRDQVEEDVYANLAQTTRLDFTLAEEAIEMIAVEVVAERDAVMNSDRTGAATFIDPGAVTQMPSIKRSTRDLTRLDPRSDGNFSFGGRNWLYNNISLDGSYFNNPFGLDDPAPGGQTNSEPVPFDAVEQVQVSIAPFDVREGGFTGAGINTVTKSGTNELKGSFYSFYRSESLIGNTVSGDEVVANPDLTFNQTGFTISGPIVRDKVFFFLNGEIEGRDDPGTNFIANRGGSVEFGESRADKATMDLISQRMSDVYNYDTGGYDGFVHETSNTKLLLKLDWNISAIHKLTARYNYLDAQRDLPPHGFVLSYNNTGRGPNVSSLPFQNAGYTINNQLHSLALEVNSIFSEQMANRFFFSYNRFRDFRETFSEDFPTIQIGEDGVAYTTIGQEPFSSHNILDQDVIQITNNFTYFTGQHAITVGANYEQFNFFNSFNIFRNFFFGLGFTTGLTTFDSLDDFWAATDPDDPAYVDFRAFVATGPWKGEEIDVGQFSVYAQDEYLMSDDLNLTFGLRVDMPLYFTEPVDNPFVTSMTLLDENDNPETVDQTKFPDAKPLFSPRVGFNWDVHGDRSMQIRGGTGIFTGRLPFVWVGNVISNPGANPNLYDTPSNGWGGLSEDEIPGSHVTDDGKGRDWGGRSVLSNSWDVNAMDPDFEWPQVWTTNLAVDHWLPWDVLGTFEFVYGKDINAVYMRNADLVKHVRKLNDGRPYYGGAADAELNAVFPFEQAGVYVIDNTDEGYNFTLTAQARKQFDFGLNTSFAYTYLQAKNNLRSTEIASVLWQAQPVQGDPNQPSVSWSEFGTPHRFIGSATYQYDWNDKMSTNVGVFMEVAQGNRYIYSGGNRYSFIYSGDVNGDGYGGNDLIYIPKNSGDIVLSDPNDWSRLDAFIKQDDYLSEHRGEIAERFGAINPWFSNIDLRILQDYKIDLGGRTRTIQLSVDIMNFANLISSNWGVRKVASPAATSPLQLDGWTADGEPILDFTGPSETYIDDPGEFSRWRVQVGLRVMF